MRHSSQERLRQQVQFLRRQFLQDGELPFTNVVTFSAAVLSTYARKPKSPACGGPTRRRSFVRGRQSVGVWSAWRPPAITYYRCRQFCTMVTGSGLWRWALLGWNSAGQSAL